MNSTLGSVYRVFHVGDLMLVPRPEGFVCAEVVEVPKGVDEVVVAWGDVVMPVAVGFGDVFPVYAGRPEYYQPNAAKYIGQIRAMWQEWRDELKNIYIGGTT